MADEFGQLIVEREGAVVQTLSLAPGAITLGRTPDNGLVLSNAQVSRRHAEIRVDASGTVLTDTGSSNGTWVGETRLLPQQPRPLAHGETFRIGPFTLTYQAAAAAAPAAVVPEEEPEPPPPPPPPRRAREQAADQSRAREQAAEPEQAVEPEAEAVSIVAAEPLALERFRPERRETFPVPLANGGGSRYARDLPIIFHEADFLGRFLQIFETIWEPFEHRQDHIEMYFDPRTCPARFIAWLASWLDLAFNTHWPESRRRRLLGEAMDLYRWRGTRYGLVRMIEVATGLTPTITEEPSRPFLFHVSITLPKDAGIKRDLIEELIQAHKPAHAGYTLEVR